MSLKDVLPCKYCRENYSQNLKDANYCDNIFRSRNTFSKFIFKLHNVVNKNLNKCPYDKTFYETRDLYENFRARCVGPKKVGKKKTKEGSCSKNIYGKNKKCVLRVIPKHSRKKSFLVDPTCKMKCKSQ